MKINFSKLSNRYMLGLYAALSSPVALAAGPNTSTGGWGFSSFIIPVAILAGVTIAGLAIFSEPDQDDDHVNPFVC